MPLISLTGDSFGNRLYLRVSLIALVAALTCWATFTSYSARFDGSSEQAGPRQEDSRAPQKGGEGDARAYVNNEYGKLPLSFEVNKGQTDASVQFVARGPGYNIFLASAEAVLSFQNVEKESKEANLSSDNPNGLPDVDPSSRQSQLERSRESGIPQDSETVNTTLVKMRFEGANADARVVEGLDELPGKVNYFLNNDASKWLTNIPTYSKVTYRNVYNGVDLVYYGNGQQLEYDLIVAPGTDPGVVKVKFDGAKNLRVDGEGNLILRTEAGELQQQKPLVYQEENGGRKLIEGRYVMRGKNGLGFRIGRYDRRKPLVIDPILSYLTLINGGGEGFAIAVDSNGFAYISGQITSAILNPTAGAFQTTFRGVRDAFVTKLNQAGSAILYTTYLGSTADDSSFGIAVDAQQNAYVTGYAASGFPTTAGAYQTSIRGGTWDCYVTKLNPAGNGLVYSTFYGGNDFDEGNQIAVDAAGNAYIAGDGSSTNLVTSVGAVKATPSGGSDAFLIELNPSGTALLYASYLGGGGDDFGVGITLDSAGDAYMAGYTSSFNFPQANSVMGSGQSDRGLFKTNNGGAGWTLRRTGLTSSFVYSLAIDKTNTNTIYAGTPAGVSKSTDGALNWTDTGPSGSTVLALAVDPSNPSIVYAGAAGTIYKTTNGGSSWSPVLSGVSAQALTIDPTNPATIYAGSSGGVRKSTDSGATWILRNTGLSSIAVVAVIIDPTNTQTLYVAAGTQVFKSTNGAASWTPVSTGLPGATLAALAINPITSSTLYAGSSAGMYKTTNGGTNWSSANNGFLVGYSDNTPRVPSVTAIAVDPVLPSTVYAVSNSAIFLPDLFPLTTVFDSTDGGATWNSHTASFNGLNAGFLSLAIDPSNHSTIYVGSSGDFDGFASKISTAGAGLQYSTYLGGGRADFAASIAVDAARNAYITGYSRGAGFPITQGASQTIFRGTRDAFVTKLNPSGTSIVYSTYIGGSSQDSIFGGIAVDSLGSASVTGWTTSTDFPVTPGAFQSVIGNPGTPNSLDQFVTKLNPSGTGLVYSSYLGGSGNELSLSVFGNYLAIDPGGSTYILGSTSNPSGFPYFDSLNGFGRTYVAKIDSNVASYSITGRITTASNVPIAGIFVEVTTSQGFYRSATTDSQGFYSIISLPAGDYTVTPAKFGSIGHYLYTPGSRTFAGLNSDQTANFIATQIFDIQGRVASSTMAGLGIFDVTVTLSGTASAIAITDANGNYFFQDLLPGNYTVTPSKAGFTFNPPNRTFTNLSANQLSADFTTASAVFFTVSGRVANQANTPISNVFISLMARSQRGSRVLTTQTNASGNYSFPNLQSGANYTLLAAKPLVSFTPQNPTLVNLSANQTVNLLATPVTGLVGKIAFSSFDQSSQGISVINADGTGETRITNAGNSPAWSPDGSKIAFASNRDATTGANFGDLYVMNADGTEVTRLTDTPFEEGFPSWSPNQQQLTYTYGNLECSSAEFGSQTEVFVANADGGSPRNLTNTALPDGISDWSPQGSSIAFTRAPTTDCSSADGDIYAIDPGSGIERVLANSPQVEFAPVYSPDGSRIVYVRENSDADDLFSSSLYVMNADGTGSTKIGPDFDFSVIDRATWSPDGNKIGFSTSLFGLNQGTQIFVINADGTEFAQITTGTTIRFEPSWRHVLPTALIADQVTLNTWKSSGRTYAYVKLSFPNDGYRVANWGQLIRAGNDFTTDAALEKLTGPSVQTVTTTAQIYDLGPLADGSYTFTFKTSGTLARSLQFTVSSVVPPPNPIDDARQFVKQQYRDFLNREADQAGEDFWTDNITKCNDPARRPAGQTVEQCTVRQRETTSGAFFLSPEFQYTGYFVYRMYQGALGRQPKLSEFTPDALFVGNGIIVNGQLSAAKINQNKADFAAQFVNCVDATRYRCAEFKAIYDGLSNQQYVDKLFQTTGVNVNATDRTALVNGLNDLTETRASVVQKVVDGINVISEGNQQFTTIYGQAFYTAEFNRAFVQLEYFGYMKRDPDEAGYSFWLGKLNTFGGDFVAAEMVLAFISSPEYRARFGQP